MVGVISIDYPIHQSLSLLRDDKETTIIQILLSSNTSFPLVPNTVVILFLSNKCKEFDIKELYIIYCITCLDFIYIYSSVSKNIYIFVCRIINHFFILETF